jgi:membrane protease YdiL (CAAX protease family)
MAPHIAPPPPTAQPALPQPRGRPTIRAFIQAHPVLSYYLLTFALSFGSILILVGPGAFRGTIEPADVLLPFGATIVVGPSVAGLLLTALVHGRAGLRDLRSRLLRWRVGVRWYAAALLIAPLSLAAVCFSLSLFSRAFLPGIVTTDDKASLLLSGIVTGLLVGCFEELGWTGFAIPELRRRHGILATGLIVGVLWGVWHYPLFAGSSSSAGVLFRVILVPVLLFSFLPPFRVLMVWVYDRTGSLLLAMLMHASLTGGMLILQAEAATGVRILISDLVLAALLWVVVAAVSRAGGMRPRWESGGRDQQPAARPSLAGTFGR